MKKYRNYIINIILGFIFIIIGLVILMDFQIKGLGIGVLATSILWSIGSVALFMTALDGHDP